MDKNIIITATVLSLIFGQGPPAGQTTSAKTGQNKPTEPPKMKPMEEALKNTKEIPGLITLYQDTTSGKLYMLIKKDNLDKEYIHFIYGANGHNNTGITRGWPYYSKVIKLKKYFTRIAVSYTHLTLTTICSV